MDEICQVKFCEMKLPLDGNSKEVGQHRNIKLVMKYF